MFSLLFSLVKWGISAYTISIVAKYAFVYVGGKLRYRRRYIYKELPNPRCIRLIRPIYDPKSISTVLDFEQATFPLDDCPTYVALSYTWGQPITRNVYADRLLTWFEPPKGYFRCNSIPFRVTTNLHFALQMIIQSGSTDWHWIDAVCIDQENLAERASQVSLMGEIYSKAACTKVWLGPRDYTDQSFLWMQGEFFTKVNKLVDERGLDYVCSRRLMDPSFMGELGLEMEVSELHRRCREYVEFYRRRAWFNRSWVLQEAALAQRIVVICDQYQLEWSEMADLAVFIRRAR